VRREIEDHYVAAAARDKSIHAIAVGFEKHLKVFSKSGGEQGLQRAVFRVESDPDHGRELPPAGFREWWFLKNCYRGAMYSYLP
jgi:hypothetical protein